MENNDTFIDDYGYERFEDNPDRLVHRYVAYHYLYDPNEYEFRFGDYVIHHKDGNKLNNHPNNLMILTPDEHSEIHGFESHNTGCFIATAAYGTPFAEEINVLRFWRDNCLKKNIFGVFFIDFYYWFSPLIADIIRNNGFLKKIIRMCLNPIVDTIKVKYNYINNDA